MKRSPGGMPTQRQGTVLQTLATHGRMTAREIGVRADVLWRMEEIGWVARNAHDQWHIRDAGTEALARRESSSRSTRSTP